MFPWCVSQRDFLGVVLVLVGTAGCTASRGSAPSLFGSMSPPQNVVQSPGPGGLSGSSLFSLPGTHPGAAVQAAYTEPSQAADPTSLSSKAKPSPRLYVAMARLHEKSGRLEAAEEQYRHALDMDSKNLDALLGMGRLLDREGKFRESQEQYQKAVKYHPEKAVVWNHLALSLARQGKRTEAVGVFQKAIALEPKNELYRTNLAVLFVELGRLDEALAQLRAVQDKPHACYNLGYLLQKKGDRPLAARYFQMALQRKPDFEEARQWLEALRSQEGDDSLIANEPGRGGSEARGLGLEPFAAQVVNTSSSPVQSEIGIHESAREQPLPSELPSQPEPPQGPPVPLWTEGGDPKGASMSGMMRGNVASGVGLSPPATVTARHLHPTNGGADLQTATGAVKIETFGPAPGPSIPLPNRGGREDHAVAPLPPVLPEEPGEVQPLPSIAR